jgi:hypothetical protein
MALSDIVRHDRLRIRLADKMVRAPFANVVAKARTPKGPRKGKGRKGTERRRVSV